MKINHRRKDKWFREKDYRHDAGNEFSRKLFRREKHMTKNKRLHQYHNLRDLFDDFS